VGASHGPHLDKRVVVLRGGDAEAVEGFEGLALGDEELRYSTSGNRVPDCPPADCCDQPSMRSRTSLMWEQRRVQRAVASVYDSQSE